MTENATFCQQDIFLIGQRGAYWEISVADRGSHSESHKQKLGLSHMLLAKSLHGFMEWTRIFRSPSFIYLCQRGKLR